MSDTGLQLSLHTLENFFVGNLTESLPPGNHLHRLHLRDILSEATRLDTHEFGAFPVTFWFIFRDVAMLTVLGTPWHIEYLTQRNAQHMKEGAQSTARELSQNPEIASTLVFVQPGPTQAPVWTHLPQTGDTPSPQPMLAKDADRSHKSSRYLHDDGDNQKRTPVLLASAKSPDDAARV